MLDVSDGLMSDLGHIAAASMVNIDVESARVVIDQPVQDAASAFNADPLTWVLAGGDDHAIAAVFAPNVALPPEFNEIGTVSEIDEQGPIVTVDGQVRPDLRGFDHFS